MAFKLAVANLKGGVGKSTTTLFVAECLATFENLRVLVIDLDPQSNASFMLMSRQGVENADRSGKTLPHHLAHVANDRNASVRLTAYICGNCSDLIELSQTGHPGKVDLVPSVPRLWFLEADLSKRWYQENVDPAGELRLTLAASLAPLEPFYDVMIFDCPPGFSALTRAGLISADAVLSPTIADAVSMRSLADFVQLGLGEMLNIRQSVPHYVCVSKYLVRITDPGSIAWLRKTYDLLEPPIRQSKDMTRATERSRHDSYRTFKEKYGTCAVDVRKLADQVYRFVISPFGALHGSATRT